MKKTLQDQYLLIKEGKGHKGVFLTEAKRQFPDIVRNAASFDEAAASLITKNIIAENVISLTAVNSPFEPKKKESFETAFEAFLAEAKKKENEDEKVKAEEKKVSKKVEEDASHNFNYSDDKNPDNLIFDQIMMGYYAEMKDPKNADKTMQELKDMVFKNLQKDSIHYTKDGQFGVKGLGYTTEAPGLGTPKEAKGKWKGSGYGDLKEGYEKFASDVKDAVTKKGDKKFSPEEIKAKLKKKREEELERRKKAGESLEEITLRKAIREMIDEELFNAGAFEDSLYAMEQPHLGDKEALGAIEKMYTRHAQGLNSISQNLGENEVEEAYQLVNINLKAPKKDREEREPTDMYATLSDSAENSLRKSQFLRVLRDPKNQENVTGVVILSKLLDKGNLAKLPLDINPNIIGFLNSANNVGGRKTLPMKDGSTADYTLLNNVKVNRNGKLSFFIPNPKKEVKEEDTMESLREGVEKDLADINKEAEHEVLQAKLDKIDALIDYRRSKLGKLDEDEDMKALTDKKKVKELEKDIKKLEVARKKIEKMMSRFKGKKVASKEVIDETEDEVEEGYVDDAYERQDDGQKDDSIVATYTNLPFNDRVALKNKLDAREDNY